MCNEEYSIWTGLDEFTPKAPELDQKNSLALAIAPSAPRSNEAAVADSKMDVAAFGITFVSLLFSSLFQRLLTTTQVLAPSIMPF
ncbi:hypothetical protein NC653_039944 [Populus alba x Populus x berolinensis]|uniref:Uncharacterized protein n=1 Tax=Populus alba x Populus x berolinensis TaxID=444605 RepID=A0AAD6LCF0_9ROSI|nr:hypothetical protein NC653_039944 [Populus alba x Populus x berolinensis]